MEKPATPPVDATATAAPQDPSLMDMHEESADLFQMMLDRLAALDASGSVPPEVMSELFGTLVAMMRNSQQILDLAWWAVRTVGPLTTACEDLTRALEERNAVRQAEMSPTQTRASRPIH